MEQEQYRRYNSEDNQNLVQDFLKRYIPWWPLFAGLVVIGLFCSWMYLRYATPVYESAATILVKDDEKNAAAGLVEAMNMFGTKKVVENEIEVIKSRTLAREVVTKLNLYAPVTEKASPRSHSGYASAPVVVEAKNTDSLVRAAEVDFTYDAARKAVVIGNETYQLNTWVNIAGNTLRFIPNRYYVPGKNNEFSFAVETVKDATSGVLNNLTISSPGKQSSVINLVYKDEEPRRGEDILNNLMTAYNNAAISDKNRLAANTLNFVDERLKYVVGELDSVEKNMEKFKSRNNIVDLSAQGQMFLQNMGANDQKVGEMSMQLAVLDKVADYVKSKNNDGGIVPSTLGVADPVLSSLLENLYTLELQYKRQQATTGENNPMMMAIQEQINKIKPGILENINEQRKNIVAGRQNMTTTSGQYNSVLSQLPQKERQLLDISRQQSIKNSIYTYLLEKREETALAYSSTIADSRIIDVAETASSPISPKRIIIWLAAVIVAVLAGIGFVEARSVLNRNIKSREEIEQYTSAPILGEIVFDKNAGNIVVGEGRRTLAAEQFRQLRTSLGYLGINNRHKKIAITSSISGEGKSFVSGNMGISLALIGKKVVLLEMDLRKPRLSKSFNMSREVGITNYLIGDKEPEEVIRAVPSHENLFIISSGQIPPNPSELISNGRMEVLLSYLEKHFDYIIIDTSPVGLVTDGYILSPMCDATLYVVRYAITPRFYVQRLEDQNKMRPLKNLAVVFNGIKAEGFSKYEYGSEYRHGYGYVEDDKKKKVEKTKLN